MKVFSVHEVLAATQKKLRDTEAERDALAAKLAKIDRAWADAGGWPDTAEEMDAITDVITSEPMQCLRDVQADAGRAGYAVGWQACLDYQSKGVCLWEAEYAATLRQGGAE